MTLASDMRARTQAAKDKDQTDEGIMFNDVIEEIGLEADKKKRVYSFKKVGTPAVIDAVLDRLALEGFTVQPTGNHYRISW